jgi:branched-chain amino acid transport system permease protein
VNLSASLVLEQVVNGVVTGTIYALVGAGLTLVYGTMRVLNFAHGEFFMLGGYVMLLTIAVIANPTAGILVAAVIVFCVAAAVQRFLLRQTHRNADATFAPIALTLGVSVVLQSGALLVFGETYQSINYFVEGTLRIGDFRIAWQRILIVIVGLGLIAILAGFLRFTMLGKAIRATAQDPDAARAVGVPIGLVHTLVFGISGALAAISAALVSPLFAVSPWMGTTLTIKGFIVTVLGGLGSFPGSIMAGIIIGVAESITVMLTASEWREPFSLLLLLFVLLLRPQGLMGAPWSRVT